MPNREPTINVNLKKCDCGGPYIDTSHQSDCPGAPILIPCPIPRSVTFEVALGECECVYPTLSRRPVDPHRKTCPARPVKVSLSISGKTWEESEVDDTETIVTSSSGLGRDAYPNERAAARERWSLVKALVLGKPYAQVVHVNMDAARIGAIVQQRDAVFSALADMAKAERALWGATQAAFRAIPGLRVTSEIQTTDPDDNDGETQAERWMSAYIEHLIEQVGVLP